MTKQEYCEIQFCPGIRAEVKTKNGNYDFQVAWADFEDYTVGDSDTNVNYHVDDIVRIYLPE